MKAAIIILFNFALAISALCQNPVLIKDSILANYKQSGLYDELFRDEGTTDKNNTRQGWWKFYSILKDFNCISINGTPKQIQGNYLIYGEGKFINGKKQGTWKFYVIEDKTFKKIN